MSDAFMQSESLLSSQEVPEQVPRNAEESLSSVHAVAMPPEVQLQLAEEADLVTQHLQGNSFMPPEVRQQLAEEKDLVTQHLQASSFMPLEVRQQLAEEATLVFEHLQGSASVARNVGYNFHQLAAPAAKRSTRYGRCPVHDKPRKPVVHYSGKMLGIPLLRCPLWWERSETGARMCWHSTKFAGDPQLLPANIQRDMAFLQKDVRFHLLANNRREEP